MATDTVALVPLRSPGTGKTRLSPALTVDQRAALAGAMLADVVVALRGAGVSEVVVAAGGAGAAAAGAAIGAEVVLDPPGTTSLDAALRAAAVRVGAAARLLVVAADLPTLTSTDVAAVLDLGAAVVVAPTPGRGTGGLLRCPPGVIGTAYGPGSAIRHARLARRAGIDPVVLELPGFRDVDTWDDLVALDRADLGTATAALLPALPFTGGVAG